MSDLRKYIVERKNRYRNFAEGFDEGYARFKIGETLRKTREAFRTGFAIGSGRSRKTTR